MIGQTTPKRSLTRTASSTVTTGDRSTEQALSTRGSYHVSEHGPLAGFCTITFFGSDADTLRKGWRSIGCQSVSRAELAREVVAIERGGRIRETRAPSEMSIAALSKAEGK